MDNEIALELIYNPEDLQLLRSLPVIKRMSSKRPYTRQMNSVYFDTPGRIYYDRKLAEGKTRNEALRALKRRISNAVYRKLVADQPPATA